MIVHVALLSLTTEVVAVEILSQGGPLLQIAVMGKVISITFPIDCFLKVYD